MSNVIRNKKLNNPRQKKLLVDFAIDEMDLAFCDLVHAGWPEAAAAYYAYGLTSDEDSKINIFVNHQKQYKPGISQYLKFVSDRDYEDKRELQRQKDRLSNKQAEMEGKINEAQMEAQRVDLRSKQGMLDYLIALSQTPGLDLKTKADLAKQITDLQNYKKEDVKIEDNRINFYLPITCKYCRRCGKCNLKQWAEEHGCNFREHPSGMSFIMLDEPMKK